MSTADTTQEATNRPTMMYLATPRGLFPEGINSRGAEKALSAHMLETDSLAHEYEDDAIAEARLAAPSLDDLPEWQHIKSCAWVVKVQFGNDVTVECVDTSDKQANLAFCDERPGIDVLWLPDLVGLNGPPRGQFRIVTRRRLLGCFGVIRATKIFPIESLV